MEWGIFGGIDIRGALTFVFRDERWIPKMLIGALLALGPILVVGVFLLVGYMVEIVRRVSADSDAPLPAWRGSFGTYFRHGFPAAWGLLVWLLPYLALWLGAGLALGLGSDSPVGVQLTFGIAAMVLANLYAAAVLPSVVARYAERPRLAAMFDLPPILASIRRIGAGSLAVFIVHLVVLGLAFITIWAIVAISVTTAYATMAFGHVYGQAARIGAPEP